MKPIIHLYLLLGIIPFFGKTQKLDEIHLSYNVLTDKKTRKEKTTDGKQIWFYMDEQCFKVKKKMAVLNKDNINKTKLLTMEEFWKRVDKKHQENVAKNDKSVEIIYKNVFFDKVYLYEKSVNEIIKYEVEWLEMYIDYNIETLNETKDCTN